MMKNTSLYIAKALVPQKYPHFQKKELTQKAWENCLSSIQSRHVDLGPLVLQSLLLGTHCQICQFLNQHHNAPEFDKKLDDYVNGNIKQEFKRKLTCLPQPHQKDSQQFANIPLQFLPQKVAISYRIHPYNMIHCPQHLSCQNIDP